MDPDSILEENAIITSNATCGINRREYYCRLVEHADGFYGSKYARNIIYFILNILVCL